jgi:hypothetical protein
MIRQEQNTRLAEAYRKMPLEGRDTLDRIVRKLAELHRSIVRQAAPKTSKERKNEKQENL